MQLPSKPAVLISAATAFSLVGDQVLYSVLPVYFDELGMTPIQVGIVLSANRWIRLFTNQLAHRMVRLVRPDVLFVGALVLGAVTTAMYTVTWLFSVLVVARLLWGLAWSFIRLVGVLEIMSDAPRDASGRTMGIYNGISRIGSVAGLLGGALLVDLLGYLTAIWILTVVSLIAVPLAKMGVGAARLSETSVTPVDHVRAPQTWVYQGLGFTIGAVGPGFVMATLGTVLDGRIVDIGGLSAATLTGALLAMRFVLDTSAAPWLGGLTDRYGVRATVFGFLLAGGVALLMAARAADVVVVAMLTVAFFVSGTALQAGVAGTISRYGSAAFSRYVTAADFGAAAGPLVGWWAVDLIGVDTAGIAIGGGLYVTVAVLALVALKERAA